MSSTRRVRDRLKAARLGLVVAVCQVLWGVGMWAPIELAAQGPDIRLQEARDALRAGNAREALDRFEQLIDNRLARRPALFGAAEASAVLDEPERALGYYRQILQESDIGSEDERRARFGAARMSIWVGRYSDAESFYRQLLRQPLSDEDAEIARVGLIKALSFGGRPMAAFESAPHTANLSASDRFELARAAMWAGWPDKADVLLRDIGPVTEGRLARDLENLKLDVACELASPASLRFGWSRDSDEFTARKAELVVGTRVLTAHTMSLALQWQSFDQHDRALGMRGVQGRYDGRWTDHLWVSLQGGPAYYDGNHVGLWSSNVVYRPTDRVGVEASAGREAVESFPAFDRRVVLDTIGLGLDYRVTARLGLAGFVYGQRFSDANERLGGVGKATAVLSERVGLSAQLRARMFASARNDVQGYFNPERFIEEQLLLVLRRRLNSDWRVEVVGGPGVQRVTPDERSTTSLIEGRIAGRFVGCLTSSLVMGYSNSAVSSASGFARYYGSLFISSAW